MHAAWIVVQHAIGEPDVQRGACRSCAEAAARGDATLAPGRLPRGPHRLLRAPAAALRHPVRLGRAGRLSPWPIEDPDAVEARRAEVGLPPLAGPGPRRVGARKGPCRRNYARRQAEMRAWSRSVVWID